MSSAVRLVGDIGGTNARFALLGEGARASRLRVFACDDFATIVEAIEAYLAAEGVRPHVAALSVASPVTGDVVSLTNHPWSFSIEDLTARLGLERLVIVNDFTANALAMPCLDASERVTLGGGSAVAGTPIAVIGPGTGLGVSGLVPSPSGWTALAGEGGHATMPAADEQEAAVLARMRRRFDHVSAERVLSGPGLVNLYQTLAERAGVPAHPFTAAQIADRQIGETDPLCRMAVDLFCAMLGTVASDLALTLGAQGGVFIAGGIVPRLGETFLKSRFRARFEDKGRFSDYLARIPTYVVTCPIPAFLGLAALLERAR
jgi:glucokinase